MEAVDDRYSARAENHRKSFVGTPTTNAEKQHSSARRFPISPSALRDATFRRRCNTRGRFRGPYDWKRLFALGIVLINVAAIGIANVVLDRGLGAYRPGMASLFAGLLLSIIMVRIGRPQLYLDWIAKGIFYSWLGSILLGDPALESVWSFSLFYILLVGLLIIWIGATLGPDDGRAWLVAGGLSNLLCAAWATVDRCVAQHIEPDLVLSTSLLLLGLSICGFGLSLRKS
jgi:hypothetical protein